MMQRRKTIRKILIANRGEIVLRVIRTIKELGLLTVVAYEKLDKDAYFIRYAEEAIEIGEGPITDYLDIEKMIWAAKETGADAIPIPAMDFSRKTPISPKPVRRQASPSSARPPGCCDTSPTRRPCATWWSTPGSRRFPAPSC